MSTLQLMVHVKVNTHRFVIQQMITVLSVRESPFIRENDHTRLMAEASKDRLKLADIFGQVAY